MGVAAVRGGGWGCTAAAACGYGTGVGGLPAAAAVTGGLRGFPAMLTSFIGREEAVRDVAGLLAECRLVTVTGPGGVGKTRLAGQVARQVAGRFTDGAWLAELAPVRDPAQVAAVVAAALGIPEQPGAPLADTLARVLAGQQLLLVLDNCEHVIGAAAQLCAGLLAACDDVRVLATSREPLAVAGEARYRLGPLTLPGPGDPAGGGRSEAVALFADRARRADARFVLDGQAGPVVDAAGGAAGRDAAGDRAGGGAGGGAGRGTAAGPDRGPVRAADRRGPAGGGPAAVAGGHGGVELPAAGRGRAAGVPRGVGVPGGVHAGGGRGGRRAGRRPGGAAAGGLLAADPAARRAGWPVPVCDAGDAARLRGRAAGRGRGAGGSGRGAGRVRAAGGGAGCGRVAVR